MESVGGGNFDEATFPGENRDMTPAERLRGTLARRARILWPLVAITLVFAVGYTSCSSYVRPGQWGVKQVTFGSGQGVHTEI
ncbi:MAG: hypothetical protein ABTQ32_38585, partial [Myxococcaceae bacterium]